MNAPKLAPPGAGLPGPELIIARLIFGWGRRHTSRNRASANFSLRKEEILELARRCDAKTGSQRMLIARLRGLEDSSRHWSVFMTLDHLRIVNDFIAGTITSLVSGSVPPRAASTAAVKPDPAVDGTVIGAFEKSCLQFEQSVAAAPNLATPVKYAHPWFDPLDAAGWHFMAAFHMNLHRQQIVNIRAALNSPKLICP